MKKILITGENSYIGNFFRNYMNQFSEEYQLSTISVKGNEWKNANFDPYDVIFHVAGIAHADTGKVSEDGKKQYYQVNCNLTKEIANKFKESATRLQTKKQFIFMSSIIVYGENTSVNKERIITKKTVPNPSSFYGDSKWRAEEALNSLKDDYLKVTILRPPMIYGPNSKGNYPVLAKIAMKTPIFPNVKNERSMLFVGNLVIFIKWVIDKEKYGTFLPHNNETVRTSKLVEEIARVHNKQVYLFSWLNWVIKLLGYFPGKVGKLTNKAFGNLIIDDNKNSIEFDFIGFEDSIEMTESKNNG